MRTRFTIGLLVLAITGCATPATSLAPPASDHAGHDAATEGAKDALGEAFGMSFEPAGPHHQLGTAPDGVELDLIGVPVEEVVLSLPSDDRAAAVEAGLAYLPHLRDMLHGPGQVWDWLADELACRRSAGARCNVSVSRGNLTARFTDDGQNYIVLVITRG